MALYDAEIEENYWQEKVRIAVNKSSCSGQVSLIPGGNFPFMVNNGMRKLEFEYKEYVIWVKENRVL